MSPFTPFLSEELLKYLPASIEIELNRFHNPNLEQEISEILDICQQIRQLKSRHNISKKHDPQLQLYAHNKDALSLLQTHLPEIQALTLTTGVELNILTEAAKTKKDLKVFSTAGHLCSFGKFLFFS